MLQMTLEKAGVPSKTPAHNTALNAFKATIREGIAKARERGTLIHVGPLTVSPDGAAWLLRDMNYGNRPLDPRRVADKIHLIKTQWQALPAGVQITDEKVPRINDGQHRLAAIAESGIAVPMYFIFGCPRENYTAIDTNMSRGRSSADILEMSDAGFSHTKHLAAVAELFVRLTTGDDKSKMTPEEILEYVEAYPAVSLATELAITIARRLRHRGTTRAIAAAFVRIHETSKHVNKLESFAEQLREGVFDKKSSPILKLRDEIMAEMIGVDFTGRARDSVIAAAVVFTWNAFIAGKSLAVKQIREGWSPGDDFPVAD